MSRQQNNRRDRTRHSDHDVELVRELRDSGMELKVIAEKMDMSLHTVKSLVTYRRRGLLVR